MQLMRGNQEAGFNKEILKRKDKLNTDMSQKTDLMAINIAQTRTNVDYRGKDKSALDIKLAEMKMQRATLIK